MNTPEPEASSHGRVDTYQKDVALESGKIPQIRRRLLANGFNCTSDGRYVNSSPEANIQEISWGRDRIEGNGAWLIVGARKPFAYAVAAMDRIAQRREAELERRLRLVKEYWLRIQCFIKDRPLRDAELYVAQDAFLRLRKAHDNAELWNGTEHGQHCPVPSKTLVDWNQEEYREPEELCRDKNLKPEVLAAIAAQLMPKPKPKPKLLPNAAVGIAHELLRSADLYVKSLPEQKRGIDRIIEDFNAAFSTVTFGEIVESNRKDSGHLPLLPPSSQKRKNISVQEQREKPLSVPAIREAVRRYLDENTPHLTQEQYERDREQTERLAKEGKLFCIGTHQPRTYQQSQSDDQKAIDDCMKNSRISLQDLCNLRWERFEKSSRAQQSRALKRIPKNLKKKAAKSPTSAASSPVFAGKPEMGKAAPV